MPEKVLALHRAYIAAGACAVKKNPFAAHVRLATDSCEDHRRLINAALLAKNRLCADAAKRIALFVDRFYIMMPFQRVNLVWR